MKPIGKAVGPTIQPPLRFPSFRTRVANCRRVARTAYADDSIYIARPRSEPLSHRHEAPG